MRYASDRRARYRAATEDDANPRAGYMRMRCKDCPEVRGYPYKRSHLVALRRTKCVFQPIVITDSRRS
jgi:hypothetical protein